MLKFAWFGWLKKSARNSSRVRSVIWNRFWIETSTTANPGPEQRFRGESPKMPTPGAANWEVSRHRASYSALDRPPERIWSPSRFGRWPWLNALLRFVCSMIP